ncbi:MAG: methylmalonyl Co-A mutase-associated GTPase MeaB [Bacteroidota bacterium]
MADVNSLVSNLAQGDQRALARSISIVENDASEAFELLACLSPNPSVPVIGITGPPGAGKSTLVNAIIHHLSRINPGIRIAILAVDPTSPFTSGSLLGDRLRMTGHFNNPNIYIRSLATRGHLGGLSARTIEVVDILRSAPFDLILVETVGVGQSEVEIAALADHTVVVLVPEAGDEIQTIKSGIMEIAELFVVNKSDRQGADALVANLKLTLAERTDLSQTEIPVLKTAAQEGKGIPELCDLLMQTRTVNSEKRKRILTNKALRIAQDLLLRKVDMQDFSSKLAAAASAESFNIYRFVNGYFH